jgi:hypothetical protein
MREMIQMCGWISLIHSEEALLLAWNLFLKNPHRAYFIRRKAVIYTVAREGYTMIKKEKNAKQGDKTQPKQRESSEARLQGRAPRRCLHGTWITFCLSTTRFISLHHVNQNQVSGLEILVKWNVKLETIVSLHLRVY